MRRREFISLFAGASAALPLALRAQLPQNKPARIGVLSVNPLNEAYLKSFREGLRELGEMEGQNILIEYRHAGGRSDGLSALTAELVDAGVDVIFANGSEATRATRQATNSIPIVTISSNPLGLGFVASLARPEGNITGVSLMAPESSGKRVEVLEEMVPGLANVAVLWNPNDPGAASSLKETVSAVEGVGLKAQTLKVTDGDSIDAAFDGAVNQGAQAIILLPAPQMGPHMHRIAELALSKRLPAIYFADEFPKAGGLASYGIDIAALFRRVAYYVDRLLKGARPADLPVEQPIRFELVINLRTAKALGLELPATLLARADEVIE